MRPAEVGTGGAVGVRPWLGSEVTSRIANTAGVAYDDRLREQLAPASPLGRSLLLGVVPPVVAVAEGLLLRAALIDAPVAGYDVSPWLLGGPAPVLFALGHAAQGRAGVIVTGLFGVALAAVYLVAGRLLVAIVARYVVNTLALVVYERPGQSGSAA